MPSDNNMSTNSNATRKHQPDPPSTPTPLTVPMLPLFGHRDRVQLLFPGMVLRLSLALSSSSLDPDNDISHQTNVAAAQAILTKGTLIACVPVLEPNPHDPVSRSHESSKQIVPTNAATPRATGAHVALQALAPTLGQLDRLADHACLGRILKVSRVRIGPMKCLVLLVQGLSRVKIERILTPPAVDPADAEVARANDQLDGEITAPTSSAPLLAANVTVLEDTDIDPNDDHAQSLALTLRRQASDLLNYASPSSSPSSSSTTPDFVRDLAHLIQSASTPHLTYILTGLSTMPLADRIAMLSLDTRDRLDRLVPALQRQLEVAALSDKIRTNVAQDIQRRQREMILRQQLEAIRKELHQVTSSDANGASAGSSPEDIGDDALDEVQVLAQRLAKGTYPPAVVTQVKRDLKRLHSMSPSMAEYHTLINSCDTVLSLPWTARTPDRLDLAAVRAQLDADHYGLDKVKQRIVEYVAVRKLHGAGTLGAPILCLVGPPGCGKTSIAKSVATAMGRPCERVALGGVRDEAEIRGHRRTYVGAMPGLFARALRHCGVINPVMVLDEVDKLTRDSLRGDPAAALLEVLDPEQNASFVDHYVQVPLDLSQVVFVATCNTLDSIPKPLLDRMEVIEVQGYTMSEKREIAKRKLVPKQLKAHGLPDGAVQFPDAVLDHVVSRYTRESGVRGLERAIGAVCRGLAVEEVNKMEAASPSVPQATDGADESTPPPALVLAPPTTPRTLIVDDLIHYLGPAKYDPEPPVKHMVPGLVQGLAWTGSGQGAVMLVEASAFPGKGNVQLTGQLGSVLQESAALALTWLRSHAHVLGLVASPSDLLWHDRDLHVHLPAGAVAKDGPSAGVALATALMSLALGVPVRAHLAMTGEIDLQGNVLPVGGIREKATAAAAARVTTLLVPARNAKDIADVPKDVRDKMRIVPCEHLVQVLREAFDGKAPGIVTLADAAAVAPAAALEHQLRPRL